MASKKSARGKDDAGISRGNKTSGSAISLIELRATEQIQRHHWQAAVWFRESFLVGAPIVDVVKHACKDFELSFRSPGFDSFSILKRAVHGDAIPSNEKVVGVLREVLNIVWRIAGQKS